PDAPAVDRGAPRVGPEIARLCRIATPVGGALRVFLGEDNGVGGAVREGGRDAGRSLGPGRSPLIAVIEGVVGPSKDLGVGGVAGAGPAWVTDEVRRQAGIGRASVNLDRGGTRNRCRSIRFPIPHYTSGGNVAYIEKVLLLDHRQDMKHDRATGPYSLLL